MPNIRWHFGDIPLGTGKLMGFFTIFWHLMEWTINPLIEMEMMRLTDENNDNNC